MLINTGVALLAARLGSAPQSPQPQSRATLGKVGGVLLSMVAFLMRVVERLTGPGPHVEDVVQETFLTLQLKHGQLPPNTAWRGWLYGVCVHVVRHHRRSFARRAKLSRAVEHEPQGGAVLSPLDAVVQQSNAARVRAAVAQIPLTHREVFVLYELEGLTGQDIGTLLSVPENIVWSRLRLGRAAFQDALLKHTREAA